MRMEAWVHALLAALALPKVGLVTLFFVALLSATLLPLGSEPAVAGLLYLNPELFWPAMFVATAGNTIGGAIKYISKGLPEQEALAWLERFGPKACLLAFLPVVGDPLCALAGWMRLPFWPCVGYMAVGKFLRYVIYTGALLWFFPEQMRMAT